MPWTICLGDLDLDQEDLDGLLAVFRSKWLTQGEVTRRFEEAFARALGVEFACAVSSGTAALHLAMLAAGIGPGDEVIVPSLTFVATANAVRYTGATPVFADVAGLEDLTMSPADVAARIGPRTKAIVAVHYGGYPADMEALGALARAHRLLVIEDAAHAPGAALCGRALGTWGALGCFSFFSTKNMTTGEGGMVVTSDPELDRKVRLMRSHGMTSLTWDRHQGAASTYDVVSLGYNYRLTELQASLGLTQLAKLDRNNGTRERLTRRYRLELSGVDGLRVPFGGGEGPDVRPSYHLMPVLAPDEAARRQAMAQLKVRGIQTSIHYPPVHRFTDFRGHPQHAPGSLPVTEEVGRRILTLPLHPLLREEDVVAVVRALRDALKSPGAAPVPHRTER